MKPSALRLGVFTESTYRALDGTITTDLPHNLFIAGVGRHVGELVLFGRLHPEAGRLPYALPRDSVRFVPLPYYERVTDLRAVLRAKREAGAIFEAELPALDAVWILGPHPLAGRFAKIARRRETPVVLGVRQDFPRYVRHRQPLVRRLWTQPAAYMLERSFRRLARTVPVVVVGEELGAVYRRSGGRVCVTAFSLIAERDVVAADQALARQWNGRLRLLSVGRLDAEKNPLLLAEVLAALRERGGDWQLTVAGEGTLQDRLAERVGELGVADAFELAGYVPFGEGLLDLYRRSHAFLHVSWTEGLPQVLVEAQASGVPIVATDVGGVRAALGGGSSGVLVPPGDTDAVVDALERLRAEPELRRRLVETGLRHARDDTIEINSARVAEFLASCVSDSHA
jgi:glycosyltransferase involved in cell wall biosynthesis